MAAPKLTGLEIKINRGTDEFLDTRYDVIFDGVKLGWVWKSHRGTWHGNALVGGSAFKAPEVSCGEPKRSYSVIEVLLAVHRNQGRVAAWDVENYDHQLQVDMFRLRQELGIED